MTEDNKQGGAQNKLGELFVDIGTNGLAKTIKEFNTLSGSFLLAKKGAQEFTKPFIQATNTAMQGVVKLDKLSSTMGMSIRDLQDIEIFSKLNNVDFNGYINQVKNAQQRLIDIRTGMSTDIQGFALLGLSPYDFDPKKPLEFLDEIRQRVTQLDEVTASAALRWFGFSDDLLYIWKQGNTSFNERLKLNNKEINNLREQQLLWNTLSATWTAAQSKFIANQSWVNDLLEKTTKWLEGTHPYLEQLASDFGKWLDGEHPLFEEIMEQLHNAVIDVEHAHTLVQKGKNYFEKEDTAGNKILKGIGNAWGTGRANLYYTMHQPLKGDKRLSLNPLVALRYASLWENNPANPLNYSKLQEASIPSAIASSSSTGSTGTWNVNITQNIQGTEATQIANKSANNIQATLNILQQNNQQSR